MLFPHIFADMGKDYTKELRWIKDNKEFISIYRVEIALSMPEGTLKKFVDDRRDLPEKWHAPVANWVKAFKK